MTTSGYTYPQIITITNVWMNSIVSQSSGSLNGHMLSMNVNGFTNSISDKHLAVNLICSDSTVSLPIVSVAPNKLVFETVSKTSA